MSAIATRIPESSLSVLPPKPDVGGGDTLRRGLLQPAEIRDLCARNGTTYPGDTPGQIAGLWAFESETDLPGRVHLTPIVVANVRT